MKKLIGITGTLTKDDSSFQQTPRDYCAAVCAAGGIPVILYENTDAKTICERLDGLIISGGGDVHPREYGEEITYSRGIDEGRDVFELAVCKEMIAQGKPVLGICRGHQVLCVATGGTLHQDCNVDYSCDHPYRVMHSVSVPEDSFLYPLFGAEHMVNSTHHQSVKTTGEGFVVAARTKEGIIESIFNAKLNCYGVQFHPERLFTQDPAMLELFRFTLGLKEND